jgi:serine protein kinase
MKSVPFYAIKGSPVNESPLGLFNPRRTPHILEEEYGIPRRYLSGIMSPWAVKRLHEFGGDITKFRVVKLSPSVLRQIAIAKTEPGDENNQDISSLVGKIDIRKLEQYSQNDPDAYSYSGGLCLANRGLLEFVEMFKAPIKVLHPLLTATQEGNYKGTEGFGAIPFDGIVLAHSNESEWQSPSRTTATTRPSSTASTSSRCPTACASPTRCASTRSCWPTARCPRRPARPAR